MNEYSRELELAKTLCVKAGEIAKKVFYKESFLQKEKTKNDFVTEADLACEKMILEVIKRDFPEDGILSEETGKVEGNQERVWIVDPLDGTNNFAHHYPYWGVSIGFTVGGESVCGSFSWPMQDKLFWAHKNKGAYCNGKRLKAPRVDSLNRVMLLTDECVFSTPDEESATLIKKEFEKLHGIRMTGAAVFTLGHPALGQAQAALELRVKPHDIAIAALVCEEAGLVVESSPGVKWSLKKPTIYLAHENIMPELRPIITKVFKAHDLI